MSPGTPTSRQRSSASDEGVWTRIDEAIAAIETHLAMAINHPGALPEAETP